jgi:hypothetical protein
VSILKHATCQWKISNLPHCPLFLFTAFKTQYFPYISNRDIPKVTKRQHPKLEFGHKLGEVFKKLQKSTLAFNSMGGENPESRQFWW